MSEPSASELTKSQIDVRLAFLREYLADMRHAQQLFQSTMSTYIIIVGALIAGRPSIKVLSPSQASPVYGYLVAIPFILTAFALRNAVIADKANDLAVKQKASLIGLAGQIEPRSLKSTGRFAVLLNFFVDRFGRSLSSRVCLVLLMVIADCFCFYYLPLT